jgi:CRISPR-associated endonuclease/helicase Cas3
MPTVNLYFPILGSALPDDHGYALYSVLSKRLEALHMDRSRVLIGPVLGQSAGDRSLHLDPRRSRLRLRLPAEDIPTVLPLAGKLLELGAHTVRLGVLQVLALIPAPNLVARVVTIKTKDRSTTPTAFLEAARR